jgi:hypothetical protein
MMSVAFMVWFKAYRERDKPRQGFVANTLKLYPNGAVGFIDWLGLGFVANHFDVMPSGPMTKAA